MHAALRARVATPGVCSPCSRSTRKPYTHDPGRPTPGVRKTVRVDQIGGTLRAQRATRHVALAWRAALREPAPAHLACCRVRRCLRRVRAARRGRPDTHTWPRGETAHSNRSSTRMSTFYEGLISKAALGSRRRLHERARGLFTRGGRRGGRVRAASRGRALHAGRGRCGSREPRRARAAFHKPLPCRRPRRPRDRGRSGSRRTT